VSDRLAYCVCAFVLCGQKQAARKAVITEAVEAQARSLHPHGEDLLRLMCDAESGTWVFHSEDEDVREGQQQSPSGVSGGIAAAQRGPTRAHSFRSSLAHQLLQLVGSSGPTTGEHTAAGTHHVAPATATKLLQNQHVQLLCRGDVLQAVVSVKTAAKKRKVAGQASGAESAEPTSHLKNGLATQELVEKAAAHANSAAAAPQAHLTKVASYVCHTHTHVTHTVLF
jgi:hypothetical protein